MLEEYSQRQLKPIGDKYWIAVCYYKFCIGSTINCAIMKIDIL